MLREALKKILDEWLAAKNEPLRDNPLAVYIRNEFPDVIRQVLQERVSDFIIRSSPGAGSWADVPWLSILNPRITENTFGGIYPVFLFCADGSGVYLSLNQGTGTPKQILGARMAKEQIDSVNAACRERITGLKNWGLDRIDLKSSSPRSKSYEEANIQARFYPANGLPPDEKLREDLIFLVDIYKQSEQKISEIMRESETPVEPRVKSPMDERPSPRPLRKPHSTMPLPKPFLLLAGVSGVGKSRFVRKQAEIHNVNMQNYCLIPVRPDWHEPSDLTGYVSRLGARGPRYVVTDFLVFLVAAWKDAVDSVSEGQIGWKSVEEMTPFWLCLDEMNLAPVEQYFADYLSVLETRKWSGGGYFCDPLLKAAVLNQLDGDGMAEFWADAGLSGDGPKEEGLRDFFLNEFGGIPLPPNLIVAGTVNMDETTHSFSRKVIDRALTLDFGEFFPNDFSEFFEPSTIARPLGIFRTADVKKGDLSVVEADPDGARTIGFLSEVNNVLEGTPFELAYRALNEALSMVICFCPKDEPRLQAAWDDFLMTKVLPRIEGDADKLAYDGERSLLTELFEVLGRELSAIWDGSRVDFFRVNVEGDAELLVDCRSRRKLLWMENRLKTSGFTSFWP
jgi:hypothetical protein